VANVVRTGNVPDTLTGGEASEGLARFCCIVSFGRRPTITPRALEPGRPSLVRARISSRSNSARPLSTVRMSRPCGVVVTVRTGAPLVGASLGIGMRQNVVASCYRRIGRRSDTQPLAFAFVCNAVCIS